MIALRVANISLVVILCLVVAKWVYVFSETDNVDHNKRVSAPAPSKKDKAGFETLADIRLFAPQKKTQPISIAVPQATLIDVSDLKLKGVFANKDNPHLSMAIIDVGETGEVPALVGDEVKPGVRLNGVGTDHVILSHNGKLTRLGFSEHYGVSTTAPTRNPAVVVPAVTNPQTNQEPDTMHYDPNNEVPGNQPIQHKKGKNVPEFMS